MILAWNALLADHRARCFSAAATMPVRYQQEVRDLIDRLVAEGASFETARRELLPLFVHFAEAMKAEA